MKLIASAILHRGVIFTGGWLAGTYNSGVTPWFGVLLALVGFVYLIRRGK